MFDKFLRESSSLISPLINLLPNPMWATWPVFRTILNFDKAKEISKLAFDFINVYVENHKQTLDPENIRDFTDLMLLEIKNTSDPSSSFYGKIGKYFFKN